MAAVAGAGSAGGSGITIEALVSTYLADRGFGEKSSQAWALLAVRRAWGSRTVPEITAALVGAFKRERGKAVASATVRRELGAFKAAVVWGQGKRLVPEGAGLGEIGKLPPEGAPRGNYLDEDEEGRLWSAAWSRFSDLSRPFRECRGALFVLIALETGARAGAIRGLEWSRVDLAKGLIDFREPGRVVSRKRRVPVPISDRLRPVLELAQVSAALRGDRFVLRDTGAVRNGVAAVVAEAGVECSIHDLRRTWASLRAQWGVPLEQVAAVLGDSLAVVEKHYAHLTPGFLRSAVNVRGARAGVSAAGGGQYAVP